MQNLLTDKHGDELISIISEYAEWTKLNDAPLNPDNDELKTFECWLWFTNNATQDLRNWFETDAEDNWLEYFLKTYGYNVIADYWIFNHSWYDLSNGLECVNDFLDDIEEDLIQKYEETNSNSVLEVLVEEFAFIELTVPKDSVELITVANFEDSNKINYVEEILFYYPPDKEYYLWGYGHPYSKYSRLEEGRTKSSGSKTNLLTLEEVIKWLKLVEKTYERVDKKELAKVTQILKKLLV